MKNNKYIIEQRNKFLEDIDMKPHQYGVNFIQKADKKKKNWKKRKKKWKKQQKKYGFDARETWALNTLYIEWLYSHLKMYLKESKDIIDLNYHKFEYNGNTYTQKELIKKMIKSLKYYLINAESSGKEEKALEEAQKAMEIWSIVFPTMWW